MLAGRTFPMHDLYQFNTGDDGERFRLKTFSFPLSLLYAVFETPLGRAGAYNLVGLTALAFGALFTTLLLSRFGAGEIEAVILGVSACALPYGWTSLMNGSPTGPAMMWWPAIMLGLDMAIVSGRRSGAWLAGIGLLFASCTDPHVFFFSALASPFWALFSAWRSGMKLRPAQPCELAGVLRCLIPAMALGAAAVAWFLAGLNRHCNGSIFEQSAPIAMAALYSPMPAGLFDIHATGKSAFIYLGIGMTLLAIGGVAAAIRLRMRRDRRPAAPDQPDIFVVLLLACLAIVILALGTNGPFCGRILFALRKVFPPYAMIRQPHKIFCLLPPITAVASFTALDLWRRMFPARAAFRVWLALQALMLVEFSIRISPGLTRVPTEAPAYDAAALDAALNARECRAVAIPLRRGTEHDSSMPVYCASLHRVRLANGYSPVVPRSYAKKFLPAFASLNFGVISDKQIQDLETLGFGYIIFHEDLFFDNTDVLPSSAALERLFDNPRLTVLRKHDATWCFRILPNRTPSKPPAPSLPFFASNFRWEAEEHGFIPPAELVADSSAGAGRAVNMRGGSILKGPERMVFPDGKLCWFVRAKGSGKLAIATKSGDSILEMSVCELKAADWQWISASIPGRTSPVSLRAQIEMVEGAAQVDCCALGDARWQSPEKGMTLLIPARSMFHTGASSPDMDAVAWDPSFSPPGSALHGPGLPLENGQYRLTVEYNSTAEQGTLIGRIQARWSDTMETPLKDIVSGCECVLEFTQTCNLPWEIILHYEGTADLHLYSFRLTRIEP